MKAAYIKILEWCRNHFNFLQKQIDVEPIEEEMETDEPLVTKVETSKEFFDNLENHGLIVENSEKITHDNQIAKIEQVSDKIKHPERFVDYGADSGTMTMSHELPKGVKQSLHPKFNPNVVRGSDGRFKSKR